MLLLLAAGVAEARGRAHLHGRRPYFRPWIHPYPLYGYPLYGYGWYDGRYGPYYDPWLEPRPRLSVTERGYVLLARGDAKRALALFAKRARRDESDAHAQLGYALAAFTLGDLRRAVWAMRRAALTDASAFATAPADLRLRDRWADAADRLVPKSAPSLETVEVDFLAAGVYLAAGEPTAASKAIALCVDAGDRSPPTLAVRAAAEAERAALRPESNER